MVAEEHGTSEERENEIEVLEGEVECWFLVDADQPTVGCFTRMNLRTRPLALILQINQT